MFALAETPERNFLLHAFRRFLERDFQVVAQVGAAATAVATATTTAEELIERAATSALANLLAAQWQRGTVAA